MTDSATPRASQISAADLEGLHRLFRQAYLQTDPDCALLLKWLKQVSGPKYDPTYKPSLDAAGVLLTMPAMTREALQLVCAAADKEHEYWLKLPDSERLRPDDIAGQLRRNVIAACEKILETIEQHEWRESTMMDVSRVFSRYAQEATSELFGNVWTALQPMFVELCKQRGVDPEPHFDAFKLEWNVVYNEQRQRSLTYALGIVEHMFDIAAGAKPFPTPPTHRGGIEDAAA